MPLLCIGRVDNVLQNTHMNSVQVIEQLIASSSEGFFDEPSIREDLHVSLRITSEFHDFLMKHVTDPGAEEIGYMMGTIRSGIDHFFSLAYLCNTIQSSNNEWNIEEPAPFSFAEIRSRSLQSYDSLVSPQARDTIERLAQLLALIHLELLFVARYFPNALLRDVPSVS